MPHKGSAAFAPPKIGGVSEGRGGFAPPNIGGVSEGRGGFAALRIPHASQTIIRILAFLLYFLIKSIEILNKLFVFFQFIHNFAKNFKIS